MTALTEIACRMPILDTNPASALQHTKAFVRRWMKAIAFALVLAVLFAIWGVPYLETYREKSYAKLISDSTKAVGIITVFDKDHQPLGQGSGFFISSDGMLVTNYHVVRGARISDTQVKLPETKATYFVKRLVAKDEANDFALLQLDVQEVPYVRLGDSDAVKAGQKVFAIGAPLSKPSIVSEGIVSSALRQVGSQKYILFSAPISSGSSGGALFDKDGQVIGITSGIFTGTKEDLAQNLNYAIPINLIRDKLAGKGGELPTDKASNYYFLGQLAASKHNFDDALTYFNQSIVLYDKDPDVYVAAANVFYEQGEYEQELGYLKKAVKLDQDNYEAIYMLGNACEDVGEYDDAIELYQRALEVKPDDKNSMFNLAMLSVLMKKDIKTARELLPELKRLDAGLGREIEALIKLASR